ncbi:MAG TPA: hypothetical protein VGY52_05130, partial [Roseiarcus sp.]|nr:hypothetical protein [Roseiarcus sp.]
LQWRRAAPHERIVDTPAGLSQTFDKESRQLGFEAGAIRDFVKTMGLPLTRGPEFIEEKVNSVAPFNRRPSAIQRKAAQHRGESRRGRRRGGRNLFAASQHTEA